MGAGYGAPVGAASAKADPVKRFLALLLDGLIAGVAFLIISGIVGALSNVFIGQGIGYLVLSAYYLLRDGLAYDFADGRSIGKKLLKLRPARLDGGPMDMETSVRRNWPLALGFVIYGLAALLGGMGMYAFAAALWFVGAAGGLLFLVECILVLVDAEGRRFGDKFANTKVSLTNE